MLNTSERYSLGGENSFLWEFSICHRCFRALFSFLMEIRQAETFPIMFITNTDRLYRGPSELNTKPEVWNNKSLDASLSKRTFPGLRIIRSNISIC